MSANNWQEAPPTAPGWYWRWRYTREEPSVVHVERFTPGPDRLYFYSYTHAWRHVDDYDEPILWAGPIVPPMIDTRNSMTILSRVAPSEEVARELVEQLRALGAQDDD